MEKLVKRFHRRLDLIVCSLALQLLARDTRFRSCRRGSAAGEFPFHSWARFSDLVVLIQCQFFCTLGKVLEFRPIELLISEKREASVTLRNHTGDSKSSICSFAVSHLKQSHGLLDSIVNNTYRNKNTPSPRSSPSTASEVRILEDPRQTSIRSGSPDWPKCRYRRR